MPTSYSTSLRLNLIATGEQAGVWGNTTNSNLGTLLEAAIAGVTQVTVTSASQALTAFNGSSDESRQMVLELTGTPGSAFTIYAPPVDKLYIIKNSTVNTATISAATALNGTTPTGGSMLVIPAGHSMLLYCDGSNIKNAVDRIVGNLSVTGNGAFEGTGSVVLPVGTTAQQAGGQGGIRYNTSLSRFEGNNGSVWGSLGGGATGGGPDEVFLENGQTVTTNYTLSTGKNAGSFGPISIDSGITVTVPSGQTWTIV
jgi:hypothetical protein